MPKIPAAAVTTLLILMGFCYPISSPSQAMGDSTSGDAPIISPSALEAHIRFLAHDLLEGREPGSRGYDIAAQYVASQFRQYGLEPLGDKSDYLQTVPLISTQTADGAASLTLTQSSGQTELSELDDYLPSSSYFPDSKLDSVPVVFVGFGVTAPEVGYDDYEGIDANGKVVAMLTDAPPTFPHDQRAYYTSPQVKSDNAVSHGAIGILTIQSPNHAERFPWKYFVNNRHHVDLRWTTENGEPHGANRQLRAAAFLNRSGAEKLFAASDTSLEEAFADANDGIAQGFDLKTNITLSSEGIVERLSSSNVVALLPGSNPNKLEDEYIVFTAHLDHIGTGPEKDNDTVFNGAYDNASGVAVLLELARAYSSLTKNPRRSLIFLAVTAEEKGLRGADYFVHNPLVPIEHIVANFNFDAVLMLQKIHDVIAIGSQHSTLAKFVEPAFARYGLTVSPEPFPEEVIFIRSDHYAFVRHGIPALWPAPGFATETDPMGALDTITDWYQTRYHQRGDDMTAPFDFDTGANFTQAVFDLGLAAANDNERPKWNENDFFGDKFSLKRSR